MSVFAKADEEALREGLGRLAEDLRTGRWQKDHADVLERDSLDVGYRLVIAEP